MGNSVHSRRWIVGGLTALAVIGGGVAFGPVGAKTPLPCPTDRVVIKGGFGQAAFNIDLAADEETRARGLMHVAQMPLSKGMLFIYDRPQIMSFWMRNTLIELDMIFVDAFGVIRHIHHRAQPLDETPISPGPEALTAALEINGGLAQRLGLAVGDTLHHPAFFSPDPAVSCARKK